LLGFRIRIGWNSQSSDLAKLTGLEKPITQAQKSCQTWVCHARNGKVSGIGLAPFR